MLANIAAPRKAPDALAAVDPQVLFSVIIVNFNGGEYLQAAVDSLKSQTLTDFELIVIDNDSRDKSAERLDLSGLPNAKIVYLTENLGFSGGVNHAAKLARGQYLALLNPDCEADPTWLSELSNAISAYPDVAMFTSTQISLSDASRIDGAGDNYFFIGIPWRGGYGRPVEDLPETGACFSACGASAAIKRETFISAGGFDEDFFCYCEDVDLGFRLRLAGEHCVFWRPALVHHAGSALSGKNSAFTVYHGTRNRVWTYVKNMPLAGLVLTAPLHAAASLYFYARCPGKVQRKAMGRGLVDGLKGLPAIWRKRRAVQKARSTSTLQLLQSMTWNPAKLSQRRTDVRDLDSEEAGAALPPSSD